MRRSVCGPSGRYGMLQGLLLSGAEIKEKDNPSFKSFVCTALS
jgi:hypothetical protein